MSSRGFFFIGAGPRRASGGLAWLGLSKAPKEGLQQSLIDTILATASSYAVFLLHFVTLLLLFILPETKWRTPFQ